MELNKIMENEIIENNKYLKSVGITTHEVVSKEVVGEEKSIDFVELKTGAVATITVKGRGVVSYNANEINLPNTMKIVEKILGVSL